MRESAAELKGTVPWWRPDATVADQEERRGSAWMLRHRRSTRSSSSAVTGRCSGGLSPATEHRFEHRTVHTRQRDNLADVAVAGQR